MPQGDGNERPIDGAPILFLQAERYREQPAHSGVDAVICAETNESQPRNEISQVQRRASEKQRASAVRLKPKKAGVVIGQLPPRIAESNWLSANWGSRKCLTTNRRPEALSGVRAHRRSP